MFFNGLVAAFLLTGLIAGILVFVIRLVMKPIYNLKESADEIAGGNYGSRIQVKRRDEIGEISENFNRMAGKVEEHIKELADTNERQLQLMGSLAPVSYTHLDVYKRQRVRRWIISAWTFFTGRRSVL